MPNTALGISLSPRSANQRAFNRDKLEIESGITGDLIFAITLGYANVQKEKLPFLALELNLLVSIGKARFLGRPYWWWQVVCSTQVCYSFQFRRNFYWSSKSGAEKKAKHLTGMIVIILSPFMISPLLKGELSLHIITQPFPSN
jgi:hypothetical protein